MRIASVMRSEAEAMHVGEGAVATAIASPADSEQANILVVTAWL